MVIDTSINEIGTDSPRKLAARINSSLEAKGITFDEQQEILANYNQQKVSGQMAQNMTGTPGSDKSTTVEQTQGGTKEQPNNEQKTDKTKDAGQDR